MTSERNLYCGEALCKRQLSVRLDGAALWPIRCPHCGVSLYPYDVMRSTPISVLEPQRAELQAETDAGRRAAISAAELRLLAGAGRAPAAEADSDGAVDRLLDMVDLGAEPAPERPARSSRWLIAGGLVAGLIVLALALLALRLW